MAIVFNAAIIYFSNFNFIMVSNYGSYGNNVQRVWSGTPYGKVKAIPLQAWTGPEGSKRLRLPDFKTIGT